MPRIFNFYVIATARLEADKTGMSVPEHGARWAQIEGRAIDTLDAFDRIDELLGGGLRLGLGAFTPSDTAAIAERLTTVAPAALATIDSEPDLDAVYWAVRDTATEATRRDACMYIECTG